MSTSIRQLPLSYGFSAVELLVVVALMSVLTAISASTFISVRQTQELKTASQDVWITIRSAHNATLSSDTDRAYGVRVEADRIVRFVAPTYTAGTTTNVTTNFPPSVTATTSFTGGVSEVVFARLTGEASATGTITLTQAVSGATSSISIAKSGLIDTLR